MTRPLSSFLQLSISSLFICICVFISFYLQYCRPYEFWLYVNIICINWKWPSSRCDKMRQVDVGLSCCFICSQRVASKHNSFGTKMLLSFTPIITMEFTWGVKTLYGCAENQQWSHSNLLMNQIHTVPTGSTNSNILIPLTLISLLAIVHHVPLIFSQENRNEIHAILFVIYNIWSSLEEALNLWVT